MKRRQYLLGLGIAAIAGCASDDSNSPSSDDSTPGDSSEGTSTPTLEESPNNTSTPESLAETKPIDPVTEYYQSLDGNDFTAASAAVVPDSPHGELSESEMDSARERSYTLNTVEAVKEESESAEVRAVFTATVTNTGQSQSKEARIEVRKIDTGWKIWDILSVDQFTIQGQVNSATGVSLAGSEIQVFDHTNEEGYSTIVENDEFELPVSANASLALTFFQRTQTGEYNTDPDDVPVLFPLEEQVLADAAEPSLGTYEIPEGYRVDIQLVDPDEEPLESLPVNLRAPTDTGIAPGTFTTNSNGYLQFAKSDQTGVVLAGPVTVELQSGGSIERLERVNVTEENTFVLTVRNPGQYQ